MNEVRLLSVLYDLTLAVGGETKVRPLLTRVLQRLLMHTALPVGVVLEVESLASGEEQPRVKIVRAIGDRGLMALENHEVAIPTAWVLGDMRELRRPEGFSGVPLFDAWSFALRLPVEGLGAIVLLGSSSYSSDLPLAELFRPVLGNFSKAVLLCRANEAHSTQLEKDRTDARTSLKESLSELEHERKRLAESELEIKAVARELERRQAIFHAIAKHTGLSIVVVDPQTLGFLEFNDSACMSLGYTRAEFAELSVLDLQAVQTNEVVANNIGAIMSTGSADFENQHRCKDGSVQDVWLNLQRIQLEGKDYIAVLWLDITERKRVEAEVRRLSQVVEQSPESVVVTNLDAQIEFVNDAFVRSTGYSREEAIGQNPRILQSGKTPRSVFHDMWSTLARGEIWHGELVNRRKDGSDFVESAIISPLRQSDGRVTHFVAIKADISERKRMTEELDRYQHHLEEMVQRRTDELNAAKAAAEAANQAKSSFLANMSHEIRTPLNAILGLTHLVRLDTTSPRHREQLDKVHGAAHHLLSIINDILDLSKIEADRMKIESSEFDVQQVVSGVRDLVSESVRGKGLELVVDVDGVPRTLQGDSLRVGQILLNFTSNAVKFTAHGQVTLRGVVVASDPLVTRVRFEVVDTGIGLNEEERARLFQAFQQADLSTTRKYGGTGLGLVIARRLALLMGGDVGCESVAGQGSTFWLEVPFGTATTQPVRPSIPLNLAGKRALLIDDHADPREMIAGVLSSLRLRVDAVSSGARGLDVIASADALDDPYDLVLIDWKMNELDGLDTGHRLAQLSLKQRPLPLLISADEGVVVQDWRGAGFAAALVKPITSTRLLDEIRRALTSMRGDHESSSSSSLSDTDRPEVACRQRAHEQPIDVLLVEDNELNLEVAVELLRRVDLHVECARNGREALENARAKRFDLVLMDVQMPEMNGLDATRLLRELVEYRSTPILAMTASAFNEDAEECRVAGMNDHIPKPVDPSELYRALLRWWPTGGAKQPRSRPDAPKPSSSDTTPRPPVSDEASDRLNGLSDFVLSRGLVSVQGNLQALMRLCVHFRDLHRDDASRYDAALAAGDLVGARRVAHSLAGVAGLIGLTKLQALAASLDLALKHGETPSAVAAHAAPVWLSLQSSMRELDVLFPTQTAPALDESSDSIDWPRLREHVTKLAALLAESDTEAGDLLQQIRDDLQRALGATATMLGQKVDQFDYRAALALLQSAIEAEPRLK